MSAVPTNPAPRPTGQPSRRQCLVAALALAGAWSGVAHGNPTAPASQRRTSASWPERLALDYDVSARFSGIPVRASGQLQWLMRSGGQYEASLAMRLPLVGGRTQRSRGRLLPDGLQPTEFSDQTRRTRRFELDWTALRYRYQRDSEAERVGPLQTGTQDRLSLFFELARRLQRQTPVPDTLWSVPVLGPSGVQAWTLRLRALEQIQTPAGPLAAWRLERHDTQPDDSRLSLWLAEAVHYLPVRILLQEPDGDWADQRLQRLPAA